MRSPHLFSAMALAALVLTVAPRGAAQDSRFKDVVFPSAVATLNIPFGTGLDIGGSTVPLLLDFYAPASDTLERRPLVIFIHGGSLVVGGRGEMSVYCTDFARRGYAAASIDYRLGIESPKGVTTILEALLRGVQDTKAAVRFFRSKAADYGIDTTQIFLAGSSAGSMVAVHYAYWDQDEIPPDVDQTTWGDIEGTGGNPGYSTAVQGIVNYCGAILDPEWIDADEPPVANFHGLLDPVVPADSGVSTDFGILMYGGYRISKVALQKGIYHQGEFFPLGGHGGDEVELRRFSSNFLYSLMVLSSGAPEALVAMELSADSVKVFRYDTFAFTASAVDTAGNRIVLRQSMVQYSCDAALGTVAPTGVFTPSDVPDSGYVYAHFNGTTDSCFVRTFDLAYFVLRPRVVVTDTLRPITFRIDTYDADSVRQNLPITRFSLTLSDPSVGSIDAAGTFVGKSNGTTKVIATFSGRSDTGVVRVETASGLVNLDPLESLEGWTITGEHLDSLSVVLTTDQQTFGSASFQIGYKLTYDAALVPYMIYLQRPTLLYGIPDSIYVDAKSDGRLHRLYYRFSDAEGAFFRGIAKRFLNSTSFAMINTPMAGLAPLTAATAETYPLTLDRIEIQLAGEAVPGKTTSGTIYLDNLKLKYPGSVTGVETRSLSPAAYGLEQNYPNPFNPSTTIVYAVPSRSQVSIVVYNMLGQRVAEVVNAVMDAGRYETRFDAAGLPSGVYLYRLKAGHFVQTRKLVVVQ